MYAQVCLFIMNKIIFRASNLGYIMYRMGLLAVLRSRYKQGKSFLRYNQETKKDELKPIL